MGKFLRYLINFGTGYLLDIGILGMMFFIILVVVLRGPEFLVRNQSCHYLFRKFARGIHHSNGFLSHFLLLFVVIENYRAVLLPDVRPLSVQLAGVVCSEKYLEQGRVKIGRASCRERGCEAGAG